MRAEADAVQSLRQRRTRRPLLARPPNSRSAPTLRPDGSPARLPVVPALDQKDRATVRRLRRGVQRGEGRSAFRADSQRAPLVAQQLVTRVPAAHRAPEGVGAQPQRLRRTHSPDSLGGRSPRVRRHRQRAVDQGEAASQAELQGARRRAQSALRALRQHGRAPPR